MISVYNILVGGGKVRWTALDEQGRYEAWSWYVRKTKIPFIYTAFCDHMDKATSSEQNVG